MMSSSTFLDILLSPELSIRALQSRTLSSGLRDMAGLFDSSSGSIMLKETPHELFYRVREQGCRETDLFLSATSSRKAYESIEDYYHELTHWYQTIGTPYGQIILTSNSAIHRLVRGTCQRLRDEWPGTTLKKPFTRWARSNLQSFLENKLAPNESYIITQTIPVVSMHHVWELLEGDILSSSIDGATSMLLYASVFKDADFCQDFWKKVVEREKKKLSASSPIALDGEPLGGKALLEGHARAAEDIRRITIRASGRLRELPLLDNSRWFGIYSRAFDYMLAKRGLSRSMDMSDLDWRDLLLRFCALCELALFTPIDARHRELWNEEMNWTDFHPGWRFVKLVDLETRLSVTRNEKWGLYLQEEISGKTVYMEIVDAASKALGWPTITEFIELNLPEKAVPHIRVLLEAQKIRRRFPVSFLVFADLDSAPKEAWELLDAMCPPPIFFNLDTERAQFMNRSYPRWLEDVEGFPPAAQYMSSFQYSALVFDIGRQLFFRHGPFRVTQKFAPDDIFESVLEDCIPDGCRIELL